LDNEVNLESHYSELAVYETLEFPTTPVFVGMDEWTHDSVRITWSETIAEKDLQEEYEYRVIYRAKDGDDQMTKWVKGYTQTVRDLIPSTKYFFKVQVRNSKSEKTSNTAEDSNITLPVPPAMPNLVSHQHDSITFEWTEETNYKY
jgi:hypothetical protein